MRLELLLKSYSSGMPQKVLQFITKYTSALFSTRKIENHCSFLTCLLSVLILTVNSSSVHTGIQMPPNAKLCYFYCIPEYPYSRASHLSHCWSHSLGCGCEREGSTQHYGAWTAQVLTMQLFPLHSSNSSLRMCTVIIPVYG